MTCNPFRIFNHSSTEQMLSNTTVGESFHHKTCAFHLQFPKKHFPKNISNSSIKNNIFLTVGLQGFFHSFDKLWYIGIIPCKKLPLTRFRYLVSTTTTCSCQIWLHDYSNWTTQKKPSQIWEDNALLPQFQALNYVNGFDRLIEYMLKWSNW